MEAVMKIRMRVLPLLILLFASLALAGGKKKVLLPPYVLNARTVVVLIDPTAGTSVTTPLANKTAQEDVEKALAKWGRLSPVLDTQTADLVITVRKGNGKIVQPTIGGLPTNDRPVIIQPRDNGGRVGVQQGHPPGTTQTGPQTQNRIRKWKLGRRMTCMSSTRGTLTGQKVERPSGNARRKTPCVRPTFPPLRNSES